MMFYVSINHELLILCFSNFKLLEWQTKFLTPSKISQKCLEEALEFAVEDTSPPFENIISRLGSFDLSHSPPPSITVEEESVGSVGDVTDKVSISAPPLYLSLL